MRTFVRIVMPVSEQRLTMERVGEFGAWMVLVSMLLFLAACNIPALPDAGEIHIGRWAEIKGSDKDVSEILAAFNRAEEALHARDLDGLMALYSEQYHYHGLSKSDLRKIWEEMFASYGNLASTHTFSRIHVGGSAKEPTADITCTGSLWGSSKETGKRVFIDSWFYEIHHVVYENGAWRIRGHAGEDTKALPFGTSPHPFF
jgi:ketosteroid isomerase-like protein